MTSKKKQKSYQQLKTELESSLSWFESDNIDIDEAINKYKSSIEIVKELETYLKEAENTIKKL